MEKVNSLKTKGSIDAHSRAFILLKQIIRTYTKVFKEVSYEKMEKNLRLGNERIDDGTHRHGRRRL